MIDTLTWSGSLVALAFACLAILPLGLPLADAAAPATGPQQSLRSALAEAFSHQGFWLLALGFFACGFHLAFIANHLPSYLRDKGMAPSAAVVGLAIIALAIAVFYFLPLSHGTLYAFCAVMGFLWLSTVPLTNGVLSQIFGVRYLTTLFGFVFFSHQLGSFLGVWLGGYVFDTTRSYDLLWQLSVAIGFLSAALHYPIKDAEIQRPVLSGAAA